MKLTELQLKKLKEKLSLKGLLITEEHHQKIKNILNKSTFNRFCLLINWLKNQSIRVTDLNLFLIFRIELVISKIIFNDLKILEMKIQRQIILWMEKEKVKINDLKTEKFYRNNSKNNDIKKLIKSFESLPKKNFKSYSLFIENLSWGTQIKMISLLEESAIKFILHLNQISYQKIIVLKNALKLRNKVAHNQILFSTEPIYVSSKKITINQILINIEKHFSLRLIKKINRRIDKMEINLTKKHCNDEESCKEAETLFDKVHAFLLKGSSQYF